MKACLDVRSVSVNWLQLNTADRQEKEWEEVLPEDSEISQEHQLRRLLLHLQPSRPAVLLQAAEGHRTGRLFCHY